MEAGLITSPDGSIFAANLAACELFGRTEDEICKAGRAGLVDSSSPDLMNILEERARTGKVRGELILIRGDGTRFTGEVSSAQYEEADGNIRTIMFIRDLSEIKRSGLLLKQRLFEANRNAAEVEAMLASQDDAVLMYDLDVKVRRTNPSFTNIYGFDPVGLHVQDIIKRVSCQSLDGKPLVLSEQPTPRALRGEHISGTHFKVKRGNGSTAIVETFSRPLLVDGDVIGSVTVWHDITEQKLAEEVLKNSSKEINELYEYAPCGYHSVNSEGMICKINNTELEWLGYSKDELVGKVKWVDLITPRSQQIFRENFPKFMERGFVRDLEMEIIRKDGTKFIGLVNATAVKSQSGEYLWSRTTVTDITERKKLDLALAQNEERYRKIVEDQTETICRMQADGTVIFVNEVYCRFFGLLSTEIIGNKWHPVAYPEDIPSIEARIQLLSIDNPIVDIENRVYSGEGELRWMHFVNLGIFDACGQLVEIQSVGRDITEQKRLVAALATSEKEFRLLAEAMPQFVWITRADGWNIYFNQQWVDYTGLTLEESYGHGWITPFHIDDQKQAWDTWQQAVNNQGIYTLESRLRRADGEYRWWLIRGVPALDDTGKVYKWFGTCTDIHEIKQAEAALLDSQERLENRVIERTEQLRQLAVQVTLAEEHERKAIARDLHDDLGQILHVTKVKFDGLTKMLSSELHSQISELNTLIADANRHVRSLTSQLSPPILRDLGLGPALHWLGDEMRRNYNLVVEVRIEDMHIMLAPVEAIILFRAARELLINVSKHAESDTAEVELYCRDGCLLLTVEDEGVGIENLDLAPHNHKGFGLSNVRERIIFLGGSLELNSKPHGGTRAVLNMPFNPITRNRQ